MIIIIIVMKPEVLANVKIVVTVTDAWERWERNHRLPQIASYTLICIHYNGI